jgi:Ca2+-binding RTX toxin-like protein
MPVINFDDRPAGTVDPRYVFSDNVVFTDGVIGRDASRGGSGVLGGSLSFFGPVGVDFLNPVNSVRFDAGVFDSVGSTRITIFDRFDDPVISTVNRTTGIPTFNFTWDEGISRFTLTPVGSDTNGFAIDNLSFPGAGGGGGGATPGNDVLSGTPGPDTISALAGNDVVRGGGGNDVLAGDDGNDQLFGEDGEDRLSGGLGDDTLDGGFGNDFIAGGPGRDVRRGGFGSDVFSFNGADSTPRSRDLVLDFNRGDRIDVAPIDANTNLPGNQGFRFVGSAVPDEAGELGFVRAGPQVIIRGNWDRDLAPEFEVAVAGSFTPAAADFFL